MQYKDASAPVISNFNFELMQGERVILDWDNGGGKSSFIKAVLGVGKELFDYEHCKWACYILHQSGYITS